ncbi:hypothetical protein [Nakamurella multipartita]|nr:hypothetical protein [Nakamurella multipartita]
MLSLAIELVREILPWLITAGVLVALGVVARWLYRRSHGRL